jgi:hypothetical protein
MKTKITVSEFTHDDLTCLLSTALCGTYWSGAGYDKEVYKTLSETHGNCFEDKLADMLLAGHKITVTDYEANGEKYSDNFVGFDGDNAVYKVGLNDFLKVASTKKGYSLAKDVISGEGDFWTADSFLQRVVFGEEIYG